MPTFAGRLLLPDDVLEGTLTVEGGAVVSWEEGVIDAAATATGWIVPAPVNAHTHVADAFLRDRPGKPATVAELVGPGGWKAQALGAASAGELEAGIRAYTAEMAQTGAARFIDFREGGVAGIRLLRDLAPGLDVEPIIMGRPATPRFDEDEARQVLALADGVGLSARRDFPRTADVEAWADACRAHRKPLALHAAEAREEDLDAIVALDPAFLVHCTRATDEGLRTVADADVPVVVCPRSNMHYGMKSPVDRMRRAGVRIAVGTDNGMLATGDILAELALLHTWFPAVPTADLLRMATTEARRLAGLPSRLPRPGDPVDHVVLPLHPFQADARHRPGLLPNAEAA